MSNPQTSQLSRLEKNTPARCEYRDGCERSAEYQILTVRACTRLCWLHLRRFYQLTGA